MPLAIIIDLLPRLRRKATAAALEADIAAFLRDENDDLFEAHQRWEDEERGRPFPKPRSRW